VDDRVDKLCQLVRHDTIARLLAPTRRPTRNSCRLVAYPACPDGRGQGAGWAGERAHQRCV